MSNNEQRKPVFGKNFTLIELLVVIAIIAILAALLLPALPLPRCALLSGAARLLPPLLPATLPTGTSPVRARLPS